MGIDHMDMEFFKRKLIELQEGLLKRYLESSKQEDDLPGERPSDIMDLASDSFEDDLAATLSEREAKDLFLIRDALRRIDDGKYGVCEECKGKIGAARLEARPHATLCIECKQKIERMSP
jgi:DnaK suppressor protein